MDFSGVEELDVATCWDLLSGASTHQVGRLGMISNGELLVLPIGFGIDANQLVFRTHEGKIAAQARSGESMTFEADAGHPVEGSGWSVMIIGQPEVVTDTATISRMRQHPPFAWGSKYVWIRLHPEKITGRRVIWPRALTERARDQI